MPDQPSEQEPNMRAAEYVLGTLSPAEAAELASALEHDRELRLEVAYWEEQLGQLGLQLTPIDPPAGVWQAIRTQTHNLTKRESAADITPQRRRSSRLWQGLAAAASIAALVLAGLLYMTVSEPPEVLEPSYASMFFDQPTATSWLVTASSDTGQMSVMAMGDYPLPQDKELRLWIIPQDGTPIASGLVPAHGRNNWQMSPHVAQLLDEATTTFAVSMEVVGAPLRNGPQGPILWQAPVAKRAG